MEGHGWNICSDIGLRLGYPGSVRRDGWIRMDYCMVFGYMMGRKE